MDIRQGSSINSTLDKQLCERILADVKKSYGSLEDPKYHFASSRYHNRSDVSALIDSLPEEFEKRETTDLNDDVSFVYIMREPHGEWCGLWISMVGPYAFIDGPTDLKHHYLLNQIRQAISSAGFTELSREVLDAAGWAGSEESALNKKTLFEVLFSEDDPPWSEHGVSD